MTSNHVVEDNLAKVTQLMDTFEGETDLLMLPENFAHMPRHEEERTACAEEMNDGPIQLFLSQFAKQHHCWLVAGSVPIRSDNQNGEDKIYQACLVYDDEGKLRQRYNKVHLFDVTLPNGEIYQESRYIEYGQIDQNPTVQTPWGLIGLSVCYDVRFPEFYRSMPDEVFLVSVPAAFTKRSGEAHWHVLLKARAIENQVYIAAPGQTGTHSNGRETWGHSMIIGPWGEVLQELPNQQGVISTHIDLNYVQEIREQFPCLQHKRTKTL
ncbi:MAG: carbon-nitrogen hydrolase family protein [Arenicella sp.]